MCKHELTEFVAELTEFTAELSEFSSPKQYSRNSIPPVSHKCLILMVASFVKTLQFVQMALQTDKNYFRIIWHFIADAAAVQNYFEVNLS